MKRKSDRIELYNKYYVNRKFERLEVFKALRDKYNIFNALYPGSFVHITPAFVYPNTVFVDTDKGAKKFFSNMEQVMRIIDEKKVYSEKTTVDFYGQSYHNSLPLKENQFDLLISHYAGIISQPCKKYLKTGGYLLANNSHADAGVAFLDSDFKLIATINLQRKNLISENKLAKYFIPKKEQKINIEKLISSQKGIAYTNTADLYIFKKLK